MNEPNAAETVETSDLILARIRAELSRVFDADVAAVRRADGTVVLGEFRRVGTFDEVATILRFRDTLRALRASREPVRRELVHEALAAFARGEGF